MNPLKPLAVLADSLLSCIRSDAITRAHQGFAWPEQSAAEQQLQAREEAEEVGSTWGDEPSAHVVDSFPDKPERTDLLLQAAALICDLQQHGPVSDERFKQTVNPLLGQMYDNALRSAQ